ncbi:MAG: DUF4145 domain-containing protein [Bacteroidia bacterium]
MNDQITIKALCLSCKNRTKHSILNQHDIFKEDFDIRFGFSYQTIQCNGCESISFRETWGSSDDYDPETGEYEESEALYPKRLDNVYREKVFFENIPPIVQRIYFETVEAFNNNLRMLAAAGIRAIIESICKSEGIVNGQVPDHSNPEILSTKNNLQGKIFGLHQNGFLTESHSKALHELRFLGNKAIHEISAPDINELILALDIAEHTLKNIYDVSQSADKLKNKRLFGI